MKMKWCYRVKMYGQYSYFKHLSEATGAMKLMETYKRPCTLEIDLNGFEIKLNLFPSKFYKPCKSEVKINYYLI